MTTPDILGPADMALRLFPLTAAECGGPLASLESRRIFAAVEDAIRADRLQWAAWCEAKAGETGREALHHAAHDDDDGTAERIARKEGQVTVWREMAAKMGAAR